MFQHRNPSACSLKKKLKADLAGNRPEANGMKPAKAFFKTRIVMASAANANPKVHFSPLLFSSGKAPCISVRPS